MIWLKENWFKVGALVVLVIGGAFYWYEWLPTQSKKECFAYANETAFRPREELTESGEKIIISVFTEVEALQRRENFERLYKNCLRRNGL